MDLRMGDVVKKLILGLAFKVLLWQAVLDDKQSIDSSLRYGRNLRHGMIEYIKSRTSGMLRSLRLMVPCWKGASCFLGELRYRA